MDVLDTSLPPTYQHKTYYVQLTGCAHVADLWQRLTLFPNLLRVADTAAALMSGPV